MVKNNEYGCALYINSADDHPDIVSKMLGVTPSEIVIKGTQKVTSTNRVIEGQFYDYNLWTLKIPRKNYANDIYLNNPLEELLKILRQKERFFVDVFKKYPIRYISCYAYFYDFNPYFLLDKALIKDLSVFDIDLEFDLYYFSE